MDACNNIIVNTLIMLNLCNSRFFFLLLYRNNVSNYHFCCLVVKDVVTEVVKAQTFFRHVREGVL